MVCFNFVKDSAYKNAQNEIVRQLSTIALLAQRYVIAQR
jgi:hypothetical protein